MPRTSLCTAKGPSSEGGEGNHWTVRDGHSRGYEMTKSYKNGVFFFQTENSSSTIPSPPAPPPSSSLIFSPAQKSSPLSLSLSPTAQEKGFVIFPPNEMNFRADISATRFKSPIGIRVASDPGSFKKCSIFINFGPISFQEAHSISPIILKLSFKTCI